MSEALYKKSEEHNFLMFEKNFNWIRTVLTILIPSLVLLIGLKSAPPADQVVARYLLVATIIMITFTSFVGLLALRAESTIHAIAAKTFFATAQFGEEYPDTINQDIPKLSYYTITTFPYLASICLLFISAFGVVKTLG